MKTSILLTTLLFGLTLNAIAASDTLKTGDNLPKLTLTDQFDKAGIIPSNTKTIIFMADRATGQMVVSYLDSKTPAWLAQKHAVILSDIHKMPAMMKIFAFPELRSKYYSMILGREEAD
jgi:ABC-type Fe3+-hydroxamate transport system substrate-binding protein